MRILTKFLATIALIGTAAGFAAPAAPAFADNPPAYNETRQYLARDAPVGSPQSCTQRTIYLASGDYYWSEFVDRLDEWKSRTIYLRADTYIWTACIQVVGMYSFGVSKYEETTWVRGSAHNEVAMTTDNYLGSSGTYTWGSELLPLS
jgi:hypothetical protein